MCSQVELGEQDFVKVEALFGYHFNTGHSRGSRSHAPRGNAVSDALRHGTQSVPVCIPTETVGMRNRGNEKHYVIPEVFNRESMRTL